MHWIDFLFPDSVCALCGRPVRRRYPWACSACAQRIPYVRPPVCSGCGRPIRGGERTWCRFCVQEKPPFLWAVHLAVYEGHMQEHLHRLKFENRRTIARTLGAMLGDRVRRERRRTRPVALVPIPLHARRLRERGYNQAQLLAQAAAQILGCPVEAEALVRRKETRAQSGLGVRERARNLHKAFWVRDPSAIQGKRVILIDDIYTTGATCRAAASALLRAGAAEVGVACVAVAVSDHDMGLV